MCDLLKSKVERHDFLEKLEDAQASVPQNTFGMSSDQFLIMGLSGNSNQIVVIPSGTSDKIETSRFYIYALEDGYLDFTGPYKINIFFTYGMIGELLLFISFHFYFVFSL